MTKHIAGAGKVIKSFTVIKADPGYSIVYAMPKEPPYTKVSPGETVIAWEIERKELYEPPIGEFGPDHVLMEVVAIGTEGGRSDNGYVAIKHPDGHYSDPTNGMIFHGEEALLSQWNKWAERERELKLCGAA